MSLPLQPYKSTYGTMDSTASLSLEEAKEKKLKEIAIAKADLQQRIQNIVKSRASDPLSPHTKLDEDRLKTELAKLTAEGNSLKGDSKGCCVS